MSNERAKWLPGKPTQPGLYWWLPLSESRPKLVHVRLEGGKLYAEVQDRKPPLKVHNWSRVYSVGAMAGRFSERLPGAPKTCDDKHCRDGQVINYQVLNDGGRWVDCPLCSIESEREVKG